MRRARTAVLLAAGATLLMTSAAEAATKQISAGPQIKRPKGLERSEPNAFYPNAVKVHVGDKVAFAFAGFHNISYAPKGTKHPVLLAADTPIAGSTDAAGAAFWFNGKPRYIFTPTVAFPSGNSTADGKAFISSGLPLTDPPPKPWQVSFPKAGTYEFHCDVHPGMKATVTVVKKGAKIPSAADDKKAAKQQLTDDYALAKKLKAFKGPAGNVVRVGNDDAKTGMAMIAFFPKTKSIKVGDTVRFEMTKKTGEEHTVTFGPEAYLTPIEQIGAEANPAGGLPKIPLDARLFHPSDPGVPNYDGTNHGNGFLNSGVIDGDPGGLVPQAWSVKFTKAGSYQYICLLHPVMRATINVS
jgi:plastocyanin